jgi:rare lipoprotein A
MACHVEGLLYQQKIWAMRNSKTTMLACLPLLAFLILSGCASALPGDTGSAASATSSRGTTTSSATYQTGEASWYGKRYHGRTTASGAPFDMNAMTAAHKKLPFGTVVRVTDVATGRSVQVTNNDRGPFIPGRIIDLSRGAAVKLGIIDSGVAKVRVEVLG